MITFALLTLLYFLPTVIRSNRGHRTGGIFLLNLLFGWTIVGWFALLLWALISQPLYCRAAVPIYYPYYGGRGY